MIVTEPRLVLGEWAGGIMGRKVAEPYVTIGALDSGGAICAVLVFHTWTGPDIEISVAARSIPRALLVAGYNYAVNKLGCSRASFKTRADNAAAIKAMGRLGAKLEGRQRGYFGDADALIFGIVKEEYPYNGLNP